MNTILRTISGTLVVATLLCVHGSAAEFQLRSEVHPKGPVVMLSDVAEIHSIDGKQMERLTALELFPTPPAGVKRVVRVRDIQEFLDTRGIALSEQLWSGASQVTIQSGEANAIKQEKPTRVTGGMARQTNSVVQAAILKHLQESVDANEPWEVELLPLDDDQIRVVATSGNQLHVTGGMKPWTGAQEFAILCPTNNGVANLSVKTKITLPPAVVIAVRGMSKGSLIRANDVQLQRLTTKTAATGTFSRIEDVIGQEMTKSVAEGQTLDSQYIRKPLLVKKGEVVSVYVRTSGVQIRTTGRSQNEGAAGDVINVESLTDRKAFLARVTAPQEVEVYARGTTVANEPEVATTIAPPRKLVNVRSVQPTLTGSR